MPTLTFPLSVPQMLWTILLAASLSAQNGSKSQDPTLSAGGPSEGVGEGEAGVGGADPRQAQVVSMALRRGAGPAPLGHDGMSQVPPWMADGDTRSSAQ